MDMEERGRLRRRAQEALSEGVPIKDRQAALKECTEALAALLGGDDGNLSEYYWRLEHVRPREVLTEVAGYLRMPGDGREIALYTIYMYEMAEHGACFIPPSEEEWAAAIKKARGE